VMISSSAEANHTQVITVVSMGVAAVLQPG
jgi:hypothetical protein